MKHIIIYLLIFVLSISYISADYCYQETATTATACGGLDTGNYQIDTSVTYPYTYPTVPHYTFAINYTKPNNSTSAIWQVKHGSIGIYNISIEERCFDADENVLMLKMLTSNHLNNGWSSVYCYNSTDWENIGTKVTSTPYSTSVHGAGSTYLYDADYTTYSYYTSGAWRNSNVASNSGDGVYYSRLYEEGIYWNITQLISCIYTSGDWTITDNCTITDDVDVGNNSYILNSGYFFLTTANIINMNKATIYGGTLTVKGATFRIGG